MKIGQPVIWVDTRGQERPALVTAIHSQDEFPGLNVVVINDDENQRDDYGRKIERATSIVHQSKQSARGNYWK